TCRSPSAPACASTAAPARFPSWSPPCQIDYEAVTRLTDEREHVRTYHPHSRLWLCLLVSLLLSACMFRELSQNLAQKREYAVLRGTVRTERPTDLPILVVIYTCETGKEQLVDYFMLAGPGPFFFLVPAGAYRLAAFEAVNRDFTYEPGVDPSALLRGGKPIEVEGDTTVEGLDIEIREAGRERIPFAFSS